MVLLLLSFIAGVLTVAAPCILPLLPVIIGGSVVESQSAKAESRWLRPLVIAASLAVSVILFTLLIKATTALLGVPQVTWRLISGTLVILLGLNYLRPQLWERLASKLFIRSNQLLGKTYGHKGLAGPILLGAALGPVFNSCSPTYALIVAAVLPATFGQGLVYLTAYALGMSSVLLLVGFAGQAVVMRLGWLTNPEGWFKKTIGAVFIVLGLAVMFGWDQRLQTYVLDRGWYNPVKNLEQRLR
jgi:cytochrome c biogenesis protein CcdA